MKDTAAAKRYARALDQLAPSKDAAADVLQALNNITMALRNESKLAGLMSSPLIGLDKKEALMKSVSSNKLFLRLARLLIERRRVALLPAIHDELEALLDRKLNLHRALVRTAIPLSDAQKKQVEATLAQRLGGAVLGRFEVSADLIGGIWMKTGDHILDATVRGKIDSFRRSLVYSAN
jgi:F-type H+-transporting ATPase subunit delta